MYIFFYFLDYDVTFYKFLQENLGNVIYIHIADYDTQESIGFRRSDL
jgi:hypothetical protein